MSCRDYFVHLSPIEIISLSELVGPGRGAPLLYGRALGISSPISEFFSKRS